MKIAFHEYTLQLYSIYYNLLKIAKEKAFNQNQTDTWMCNGSAYTVSVSSVSRTFSIEKNIFLTIFIGAEASTALPRFGSRALNPNLASEYAW